MGDIERMKGLKKKYFELVNKYGEEASELKSFQKALLKLNKEHRLKVIKMYEDLISKTEAKIKKEEIKILKE